jgi:cytochrome P450
VTDATGEVQALDEVNFFEGPTTECPYPAYKVLRDEAPIWKDPLTGVFIMTRYEDIRAALTDTDRFVCDKGEAVGDPAKAFQREDSDESSQLAEVARTARRLENLYEEKGWLPGPHLNELDDPRHLELRRHMQHAFRPAQIKRLDQYLEGLADELIDEFLPLGHCDFVSSFAVPLPLYAIGEQVGLPKGDMPRIKEWTDAWIKRIGMMVSPEEQLWSTEMEIEAQHYFQPIFERLRCKPDDTLLSDLVNNKVPEWGRPLTDNELHAEMMADLFVAGSETTTNALSAGVVMLTQQPDLWARLKADPEKAIPPFIEEVLRLESPVQGLPRHARVDIALHGVTIPAGSVVILRYASGNRDERRYGCPADVDLERKQPRSHLGFGSGTHACLGAPLARSELLFSFKALTERFDSIALEISPAELSFNANFFVRGVKEVPISFVPTRRP